MIKWFLRCVNLLYSHVPYHNDTINKQTQEDFFNKYMYLSLYCKGSKRVTQDLRVRGSWWSNRTAIFWPPLFWPSTLCLSRSSDAQPGPWGPLCWVLAFFTASYQHFLWTPIHQGPFGLVWLSLPHLGSTGTRTQLNCPDFCLDWAI